MPHPGSPSTTAAGAAPDGPVLVTGAGGFVGANLCRAFGDRPVVAVDSPGALSWRLADRPATVTVAQVDLCDALAVAALVARVRPRLVINCAAYGAYSVQADAERIYAVNCNGLRYLLDAVVDVGGVRAVVQMGSSSEYGTHCTAPNEEAAAWPDSHYAASKVAASALVRLYAVRAQLPAFVLRLYAVYGPYEDPSRLVPQLLLQARAGRLPPLADPDVSRDFVHVDDVCQAVRQLEAQAGAVAPGSFFNIGTGTCTTLREVVDCSRALFAVSEQPRWGAMARRAWDHPSWYADPSFARRTLGWAAATDLAAGLQRTMAWMSARPDAMAEAQRRSVLASA